MDLLCYQYSPEPDAVRFTLNPSPSMPTNKFHNFPPSESIQYIEWPEDFELTLSLTLDELKHRRFIRDWTVRKLTSDGEVHLVIFYIGLTRPQSSLMVWARQNVTASALACATSGSPPVKSVGSETKATSSSAWQMPRLV